MQDIVQIIKTLPKIGATIKVHGQPVMVSGYKITGDAAYVIYSNGFTEQMIHKNNLERCASGKVMGSLL